MKKHNLIFVIFNVIFLGCSYLVNAHIACDCERLFEISSENSVGFIDCKGKVVVKPTFQDTQSFNDGVSTVTISSRIIGSDENGKPIYEFTSGIVHLDGRIITLPNTWITIFSEGLAFAKVNGKFVYLNKLGKVAIKIPDKVVQQISPGGIEFGVAFQNGFARLPAKEGGNYLVDKNGNISLVKERRREFDENGLEWLDGKDGYAVIDKNGKYIIEPKKNLIGSGDNFFFFESGEKSGTYQFLSIEGKELFKVQADYIGDFRRSLATINIGKKWGFINQKGEIKIPVEYDDAKEFSQDLAAVKIENKWGFIDTKGAFIIPAEFDYVSQSFECGLAYVHKNEYGGYIDKKGNWIWKEQISREK